MKKDLQQDGLNAVDLFYLDSLSNDQIVGQVVNLLYEQIATMS